MRIALLAFLVITFHLNSFGHWKAKYPYGLLTDDYGILVENDLALYLENVGRALPFSKESYAYNYWQCYDKKYLTIACDDIGTDPDEELKASIDIRIVIPNGSHRYWPRNGNMSKEMCEVYLKRWRYLILGTRYVCVAGQIDDIRLAGPYLKPKIVYSWTFDKFKTRKGCSSLAVGECYRKAQRKL